MTIGTPALAQGSAALDHGSGVSRAVAQRPRPSSPRKGGTAGNPGKCALSTGITGTLTGRRPGEGLEEHHP